MQLRPVRGTKDIIPSQYDLFQKIIKASEDIAKTYCFQGYATPVIEYTEIFNKTLGQTSDVVNKEMYNFNDRSDESITLRPEFTAGIMRSIFSESLTHELPLRLFSYGPLFRHDRPQAGRQRQFHQVNFEIIGENSELSDAEAVKLGCDIIKALGIIDVQIEINSLGCEDSRSSYHVALKDYLIKYEDDLSHDSKIRLHKNPMRILDSKDEGDKKIVQNAPLISKFYTKEAKARFDLVLRLLDKMNVPYVINENLVRGLDYYSHTAFEYSTNKIGAQTAIGGGGRYDGLAKMMGKQVIPAIGLACGVERMMILMQEAHKYERKNIGIFPISQDEVEFCAVFASNLREHGLPVLVYESGKLGKRIEKSVSNGCNYAAFIGQNEVLSKSFRIKNLISGEESLLSYEEILKMLKEQFG
ncbi:MAG: histidine--tRNA ligase [Rickettsiaceae bacterium]|nr:histidine--tRNA ligase [Rickettsiaceae bacterium]